MLLLTEKLIVLAIRLQKYQNRSENKLKELVNNFCCINPEYLHKQDDIQNFIIRWDWWKFQPKEIPA